MKKFLTFILVLAMVLSVSSVALADDRIVSDATYTALEDANNAAQSGDTVIIPAGTYDITKGYGKFFEFKSGVTYEGAINADGTPAVVFTTKFTNNGFYRIGDGATIKNIQFDIASVGDNAGHIFAGYDAFTMDNCVVNVNDAVGTGADAYVYVFDLNTNIKKVAITNSTFKDNNASGVLSWVVACNYNSGYNGAELIFTGNTITGNWGNGIIELLAGNYTVKDNKVDVTGKPNTLFSIAVVPGVDANTQYTNEISGNEVTADGAGAFVRYMPIATGSNSANPTALKLTDNIVAEITGNDVSGVSSTFDIVLSRDHNNNATLTYEKSPFGTSAYTTSNQGANGEIVKAEEFESTEPAPAPKSSSGSGISVTYNGGNSFSTSNPSVPTGVEIDGVPVTFNGTGSNFSVGCISSDAKWVTVRWNSTSVTTNFTPDGLVECTTVSIPKTGDMSFWAAIAEFLGF